MKLELKHITPYLPYGLKITYKNEVTELTGLHTNEDGIIRGQSILDIDNDDYPFNSDYWKPILRPLSDLTRDYVDENISPSYLNDKSISFIKNNSRGNFTLYQSMYLFEHHFDVFGLIEKGLAIDINTIK